MKAWSYEEWVRAWGTNLPVIANADYSLPKEPADHTWLITRDNPGGKPVVEVMLLRKEVYENENLEEQWDFIQVDRRMVGIKPDGDDRQAVRQLAEGMLARLGQCDLG